MEVKVFDNITKQSVVRNEQKQAIQKKIATLQNKIRKEKQLNKKIDLNAKIKKLKKLEGD